MKSKNHRVVNAADYPKLIADLERQSGINVLTIAQLQNILDNLDGYESLSYEQLIFKIKILSAIIRSIIKSTQPMQDRK